MNQLGITLLACCISLPLAIAHEKLPPLQSSVDRLQQNLARVDAVLQNLRTQHGELAAARQSEQRLSQALAERDLELAQLRAMQKEQQATTENQLRALAQECAELRSNQAGQKQADTSLRLAIERERQTVLELRQQTTAAITAAQQAPGKSIDDAALRAELTDLGAQIARLKRKLASTKKPPRVREQA